MTVIAPQTSRTPWLAWAAFGVVYVVWGSTYLGIRFSVETMPPLLSARARFVASGVPLCVAVSTVATYAYVNPVIAVLPGVWLADERFGLARVAGGLVVLCAVVLVVRGERRLREGSPA